MKYLAVLLALAASAVHADPRDTVQHAFQSVLAAGGFRGYAQGNIFGPGLPALAGDVDVVFPDRIHVRTDSVEFIVLPDRAWLNTFGIWTPADRSLLPVTAFDLAAMRKAIASIADVRVEGASKLRACPAHVYRFHSSGRLPGTSASGDVRAWLCDESDRPARVEATDARSGEHLRFDFDWTHRATVQAPPD